ncbi:capsid [uncultured virus]|uniref:Capsid n=1 Tax=uncultured virus TaxID=340016 RepID=A0A2K9LS55_9VIRU|nr:capsid [uncultured virus]
MFRHFFSCFFFGGINFSHFYIEKKNIFFFNFDFFFFFLICKMVFKRYAKKAYKKRSYKRPRKTYKKRSLTTRIKRVISSQVERKSYVIYGTNQSIATTSGGATPSNINLMPQLSQGTQQEQRVGQQVKITHAMVRGFVNLLPYNATTNPLSTPIWLKMWVVSSKLINTAGFSNVPQTSFFEVGTDTVGLQGNMLDMTFPVNKDAFTVYASKKINLGATYASATGPVGTGGYFDNSKMSVPFYFSFGRHFKQQLKYNDDSSSLNGNYPYNRNCYLVFQAVYADGSSVVGPIAEYHYTIKIDFTDL